MIIRRLVALVDNDEAKIVNRGKKGRTRPYYNMWFVGSLEEVFPDLVAFGFGLTGVNQSDILTKSFRKNPNKLAR